MNQEHYVLTIKAEARPGLLHLVTGIIEKKLIEVKSLSSAPTDIHDIILITIEVIANESDLTQMALKIENIIEVFSVAVVRYDQAVCLRVAYFKMDKAFLESPKAIALSKYEAVIQKFYPDHFLLAKNGSDATIRKLYNALDGPHLIGFIQTGLIADTVFMGEDQSSVISLAA